MLHPHLINTFNLIQSQCIMTLNFDLLKKIMQVGGNSYPQLVDPSEHEALNQRGVAEVTANIEKLALLGLIKDASPIFGANGGMWIGYALTEKGHECAQDDTILDQIISAIVPPVNEVSESVRDLADQCRNSNIDTNYKEDLVRTIDEIAKCFENDCHIAVISMCGKVMEVCLTQILIRNEIDPTEYRMIGRLLGAVRANVDDFYMDDALINIGKIISRSRNTAIHFNQMIPVPSRDQAIMVIFATRDMVNRYVRHYYPN